MIELTFADLMAIDYYRSNGLKWDVIAGKLAITEKELMSAVVDKGLRWAREVITIKENRKNSTYGKLRKRPGTPKIKCGVKQLNA